MSFEINIWEDEGGHIWPSLMRDCLKSVVHKRKSQPYKTSFYTAQTLSEVMQNDPFVKVKKNYDRRNTMSSILPTTVRG